ncbi:hypothetical protein GGF46_002381 [Coemansia sp. RSA 552]|nr:hypothetical protein GGF46_002381 [Coemansia sp. RSA 552]
MNRETWLLWLLADSQLPTGGFVASAGLEAAVQGGLVRENVDETDRQSYVGFIRSSTRNQARFALPFCSLVHEQVTELLDQPDQDSQAILDAIIQADDFHHTMVSSNAVAMRASTAQGGGLLSLFNRGYAHAGFMADERGQRSVQTAKRLQRLSRLGDVRTHWPTAFGFVGAALGISLEHAQQLYMFQFVRQLFSAAIRLNLVGPLRAQALECDMQQEVDALLKEHGHLRPACAPGEDVFSETTVYTEPIVELYQGMHDRLYSRIFNS